MPAPATIDEFLDVVRKSGLVDPQRLETHLQQLQAAGPLPTEPKKLADLLIRDGFMTYFQAEQFLIGKWRGFSIGKYDVLERLGVGGTGIVYLCEHKFMRRRVAIKVLATNMAENPYVLERFYREGQAVAALDHPNIVRAHDIDHDGNLHFLVMEYVDGASLDRIVRKLGQLDVPRACHYIRQAALGLQHAHEAGLVHRDIKPANLLLDRQGVVRILDMGLARFFQDKTDTSTHKYAQLVGTVDFLAPEQAINSDHADIRADIYSLGATLHFLLVGKPPFEEGSLAQKLIWHQVRHPKPVSELRPEVPAELSALITRMMAKDPKHRPQTPAEVVAALAPWTQTAPPPLAIPESSRLSPLAKKAGCPTGVPPPIPSLGGRNSTIARKPVTVTVNGPAPTETPMDLFRATQKIRRETIKVSAAEQPPAEQPPASNGSAANKAAPTPTPKNA
jgi:serine/threonine protein kinase